MPPKAKLGGKGKKKTMKPKKSVLPPGKKSKKKVSELPKIELQVMKPVEKPVRHERKGIRAKPVGDFFSIITLWSVDVFQVVARSWKHLLFSGKIIESTPAVSREIAYRPKFDSEINFLSPLLVLCLISTTFVLTIELGLFARKWKFKFILVLFGLYMYALSILCLLLYVKMQNYVVAALACIFEIGWHVVNPLKYFLILHQRFPIRVLHSRIIVSAMETIVFLALYLSTVFVVQSDGFSRSDTSLAWIILLVVIILLIIAVHTIQLWNLEVPVEVERIERFYQSSDVTNFQHRHKPDTIFLFALLLIPSAFGQVLFHANAVSLVLHRQLTFFQYRIDMAIGLVLAPAIIWGFWMMKAFRDEMKDLYIIGVIHGINAIVLFVMLFIPSEVLGFEEPYKLTCLLFIQIAEGKGVKIFVDDRRVIATMCKIINEPKDLRLRFNYNDKDIFVKNVVLQPGVSLAYLVRLNGVEQMPYIDQRKRNHVGYNFLNLAQKCGKNKLVDGNECKLFSYTVSVSVGDEVIQEKKEFHSIPPYNTCSKTVFIPVVFDNVVTFNITVYENGVEKYSIKESRPRICTLTIEAYYDSKGKIHFHRTYHFYVDLRGLPIESTEDLSPYHFSALLYPLSILSSISFGIAKIAYLHFIWITIPYQCRTVLLGYYFGWIHMIDWVARYDISTVSRHLIIVLLLIAIVVVIYHILLTLKFKKNLPEVTTDKRKRQF